MHGESNEADGQDRSFQSIYAGYERPPTAQEAVLQAIRQAILRGGLKPGEPIRQDALAVQLKVSRVPVREALKVLAAEGQVTYERHRGYRVADLSLEELEELYLLRRLLESEAVRLAVPKITDEVIGALEGYVDRMDQAVVQDEASSAQYLAINEVFHFHLFEKAALPRLVHYLRILWRNTDPYRCVSFSDPEPRLLSQAEHRELVDACRDRDVERAVSIMDEHRANAVANLRKVLATGGGPGERGRLEN